MALYDLLVRLRLSGTIPGVLLAQITDIGQLTWARYHDVVMPRYHTQRSVVIGDAAHATSPQLGQGTNMALLDALALARFSLKPGQGLFIDDRDENVAAARANGFEAVLFTTPQALEADLIRHNLLSGRVVGG